MPSYFFHLSFELRDQAHLTSTPLFRPPPNLNLFTATLPTHRNPTSATALGAKRNILPLLNDEEGCPHQFPESEYVTSRSTVLPAIGRPKLSRGQDDQQQPRSSKQHPAAVDDWRLGEISLESIDMEGSRVNAFSSGPHAGSPSADGRRSMSGDPSMKGKYIPVSPTITEFGWGVVHLYRDSEPSPEISVEKIKQTNANPVPADIDDVKAYVDKTCTTLCILAVPTYMTPSDLLGWMGEETRECVTHLRLVRTARSNKYMALMKFKLPEDAKNWQHQWNGRLFNSMEPENCHVVFVKSIHFQSSQEGHDPSSFPDISNDPFIPPLKQLPLPAAAASLTSTENTARPTNASLTTKPAPPPTPALIELPTCPVCLERMDDTTGLATIFCQHVFHCACLQKWRGSGCPVCRYTQSDTLNRVRGEGRLPQTGCRVCDSNENLWLCLICGHVGCGRYDEAHAFAHYKQTSHSFAMDIATQHIWDYVGDEYVHRLIQNKSDGKLVELPSSMTDSGDNHGGDMVPRDKLENMSMEYTYLLTSQLDNQRCYFEEQIDRAADKAAKATVASEQATESAQKAIKQLQSAQEMQETLIKDTVPTLERDKQRAERKAERFEAMARNMEKEWRETKVINESLMDRIGFLEKQFNDASLKVKDLEDQNRDLGFFISGMERLKGQSEDVQEGTISVPEASASADKKKKKGKVKK